MTPSKRALAFFGAHRGQARFQNRFRILPAVSLFLARLADLIQRKVSTLPMIHYGGPRWSAVLLKRGHRRWELYRKGGVDGS